MKHRFLEEIAEGVRDSIRDAIELGYKCAYYDFFTNDGFINVKTDVHGLSEVVVCHNNEKEEKKHQNIEKAVMEVIAKWSDVEKEMEEELDDYNWNGFRDEYDLMDWLHR